MPKTQERKSSSGSAHRGSTSSVKNGKGHHTATPEWLILCAPWLDSDGALYQRQDISKPPLKDFFVIWVDTSEIIFTNWQIKSPSQHHSTLKGANSSHADYQSFKTDSDIRGLIESRTGPEELTFIDALIDGNINFLDRIPEKLQMHIILHLDQKSVAAFSQTSKHYKKLCYDDKVWSNLYTRSGLKTFMTPGLLNSVEAEGWRITYLIALRIKKTASKSA
ncbi:hypothetical protein RRG08_057173 [Elysia crispata]|uniref:F-box domain-containing protein n=1 Tax=Elysia crispata TaxID=231223 RepID=A0AAE0XWV5_9GAST|nr:hypothetical protein RRG08_057173 [Elysia crispata]